MHSTDFRNCTKITSLDSDIFVYQYNVIIFIIINVIHYLNVKLNFALLERPLVLMYIYLQTPVFEKFLKRKL